MASQLRLQDAQRILGYTFNNTEYLQEALLAAGAGMLQLRGRLVTDGNKRLALVGDAVLKVLLLQDWFGTEQSKGDGNNIITTVACNPRLGAAATTSGLSSCITQNPAQRGLPPSLGTLTATIEATIGAVWLDSGHNVSVTKDVIEALGLTP